MMMNLWFRLDNLWLWLDNLWFRLNYSGLDCGGISDNSSLLSNYSGLCNGISLRSFSGIYEGLIACKFALNLIYLLGMIYTLYRGRL